jgi:hypothetical protein
MKLPRDLSGDDLIALLGDTLRFIKWAVTLFCKRKSRRLTALQFRRTNA